MFEAYKNRMAHRGRNMSEMLRISKQYACTEMCLKIPIEMLEIRKARIPKQSDEIGTGVMVTKVEKSCEMKYG